MIPYVEAIRRAFAFQEFVSTLGWVLMAAMVVGFILDDNFKNVGRWVGAGIVYVIFQEIARNSILNLMDAPNHALAIVTSMMTFFVYSIGIMIGWCIGYFGRKKARKQFQKENDKEIEG